MNQTKISKKLRAARALISDPTRWTRGTFARDSISRPCSISDKRARRFCSSGAMYRVSDSSYVVGLRAALNKVTGILGGAGLACFNDTHTHDEVLWAFDLAIAFEEVGT